jgi:hypothetical protein
MFALQHKLPTFSFPDYVQPVNDSGGTNISGSSGGVGTATRITSPDSALSLSNHLGDQMTTQGWYRDASWSGNLSSGSTWKQAIRGWEADLGDARGCRHHQPDIRRPNPDASGSVLT